MNLLRKIFWVVLTATFAFGWVVLFENGTTNYVDNCVRQFQELKTTLNIGGDPKKTAKPGVH